MKNQNITKDINKTYPNYDNISFFLNRNNPIFCGTAKEIDSKSESLHLSIEFNEAKRYLQFINNTPYLNLSIHRYKNGTNKFGRTHSVRVNKNMINKPGETSKHLLELNKTNKAALGYMDEDNVLNLIISVPSLISFLQTSSQNNERIFCFLIINKESNTNNKFNYKGDIHPKVIQKEIEIMRRKKMESKNIRHQWINQQIDIETYQNEEYQEYENSDYYEDYNITKHPLYNPDLDLDQQHPDVW